jgi:hypothetical protein
MSIDVANHAVQAARASPTLHPTGPRSSRPCMRIRTAIAPHIVSAHRCNYQPRALTLHIPPTATNPDVVSLMFSIDCTDASMRFFFDCNASSYSPSYSATASLIR